MIKRFFTHSLGGGVYENPEGQYVRFADHEAAISEAHDDADSLLRRLNLDPERYRTEAGFLNVPKIVAAIKHPDEYPRTTNQPTVGPWANIGPGLQECAFCHTTRHVQDQWERATSPAPAAKCACTEYYPELPHHPDCPTRNADPTTEILSTTAKGG